MDAREKNVIRLFISHSSKDQKIAKGVIDLIRAATNLSKESIRCTSVHGYKLDPGDKFEEKLNREVQKAEAFIGIITPNSIGSAFVLFELGARWGRNLPMVPLLGAGSDAADLEGPLKSLHPLHLESQSDLFQLVDMVAKLLKLELFSPAFYTDEVEALGELSKKSTTPPANTSEKLQAILTDVKALERKVDLWERMANRSASNEE